MANGDCPVGARNGEAIEELKRRMTHMESRIESVCDELQEIKVRRARLDGLSTIIVAVIAAAASIAATWLAPHLQ